jgi:hypothetical protein
MADLRTTIDDLPVTLRVIGGHRGSPGYFNPRDGGSPPEAAEIEFRVLLTAEGRDPLDITDYLADDVIESLNDWALDEAEVLDAIADEPPAEDYD